jgi:hypothetical protein
VKALHELKKRGSSDAKAPGVLHTAKWQMTRKISTSRVLPVVNLILAHYSISITTSGSGRHSARVEHCRQDAFECLDFSA